MTVPQHRLVVKEPTEWDGQRTEERARRTTHKPKCRAMLAALISDRLWLSAERNYGSRRAESLIV